MTRIRWRRRSVHLLTPTLTLITLLAQVPAVSAANPSSSTSSSSSSSPSSLTATQSNTQAHPSRGSKAGIFIGATVGVLAIVAAIILFFCLRHRRRRSSSSSPVQVPATTSAVGMETKKAVAFDAVLETTGADTDGHNQTRAEASSQSQQPEAEVMGRIEGPEYRTGK